MLASFAALSCAAAFERAARALGRTPVGGRIVLHVPWPTQSLDPHDPRDPAAALFAHAVADPLYALDASGNPYPALAAALPSREGADVAVRLREGLRTSRGAGLDARDVVASIVRARARGAAALLSELPKPIAHPKDPLAVVFRRADPGRVARALASPLTALLPRSFKASHPDGTGAFRAEPSPDRLLLTRNPNAARGASFLDAVEVVRADDLKTCLREFEAQRDDFGWLGLGLHEPRRGALRVDLGPVAWIVLATAPEAGPFGMPGVAQRLADALPPERLAHLGLGPLPRASGDPGWGGPPTELLVDASSPHLVEAARAIAPILSRPGHEVTVAEVPRTEVAKRRGKGGALLALDLVRPLGPGPNAAIVSLSSAEDPERARDLVKHPPKLAPGTPARALTSTLRVGVVGEVRVAGGVVPDVVLARSTSSEGWDLGASHRRR